MTLLYPHYPLYRQCLKTPIFSQQARRVINSSSHHALIPLPRDLPEGLTIQALRHPLMPNCLEDWQKIREFQDPKIWQIEEDVTFHKHSQQNNDFANLQKKTCFLGWRLSCKEKPTCDLRIFSVHLLVVSISSSTSRTCEMRCSALKPGCGTMDISTSRSFAR